MLPGRRHLKAETVLWGVPLALAAATLAETLVAGAVVYALVVAVGFLVERRHAGRDTSGVGPARGSE